MSSRPVPAPKRQEPSISEASFIVPIGLAMILLIGAIGYDAWERIVPTAHDMWSMLQSGASILVQEDSWRGIKVVKRLRQATLDGGATARNVLLNRSVAAGNDQRERLAVASRELANAMQEYEAQAPPSSVIPQWQRTQELLHEYRQTLEEVIALDRQDDKNQDAIRKKLDELEGRQMAVLRETEKLSDVHFTTISEREKRVFAVTDQLETQLFLIAAVVLILWLATLALPIAHAWWVRGLLRKQHRTAALANEHLQHLSAKLVRAQEEERRSISRELHDEIGQILIAARLDLAILQERIPAEKTDLHEIAREGKELIEQSLTKVRDLTQLLRPSLLDEQGLVPALKWLIKCFGQRMKVNINFEVREFERRLPPEYEIAAYRMVQECLNNIAKHSEATAAKISIASHHGMLYLRVEDNGIGMRYQEKITAQPGGLGLVGIRERVENLQGTLRLVSVPKGFCLAAEIPTPMPVAVASEELSYRTAS